MSLIRVSPDQLRVLESRCRSEAGSIEQVKVHVAQAIASTDWESPAAHRFRSSWDVEFRPALDRLSQALNELGGAAATMAVNYEATEAAYHG
jgi:WXG100 family type VII secretion target